MKNNQSLLFQIKDGVVKELDKTKYLGLIQTYYNIPTNILQDKSYDKIIKYLQTKIKIISDTKGIYFCNTPDLNIKLVCLIDKTQNEFINYCKKKGWLFNEDFEIVMVSPEMFTRYKYPGSSENKQIRYDNKFYMVKYSKPYENAKNGFTSFRQTAITEYLGSKLLKLYGLNVQNVKLGWDIKRNEFCVLCEDFIDITKGNSMIMLKDESSRDTRKQRLIINDIDNYLKPILFPRIWLNNKGDEIKASDEWITISVSDFLIGNRDRHLGNLGYKLNPNDTLEFVPIFDNGASLGCYLDTTDINKYNFLNNINYYPEFDELQTMYQLYNKTQVNYINITSGKLPQIFYKKVYEILGNTDIKGLNLFDNLLTNDRLNKEQIFHIKLAKMIYNRNFKILKTSIEKFYKGGK